MTIEKSVSLTRSTYDNRAEIQTALNTLLQDKKLNQYMPIVLVDAILCANALLYFASSQEIALKAKEILASNEYHAQENIIVFSSLAILKYSTLTNKTMRESFKEILQFECFGELYYHYYAMHTQTIKYAAQSLLKRIIRRSAILKKHDIDVVLSEKELELVNILPNEMTSETMRVGSIREKTAEIIKSYGTSIPTFIACAVSIKSAIENIDINETVELFPIYDLLEERKAYANNILTSFLSESDEKGVVFGKWIWSTTVDGFLPAFMRSPRDQKIPLGYREECKTKSAHE